MRFNRSASATTSSITDQSCSAFGVNEYVPTIPSYRNGREHCCEIGKSRHTAEKCPIVDWGCAATKRCALRCSSIGNANRPAIPGTGCAWRSSTSGSSLSNFPAGLTKTTRSSFSSSSASRGHGNVMKTPLVSAPIAVPRAPEIFISFTDRSEATHTAVEPTLKRWIPSAPIGAAEQLHIPAIKTKVHATRLTAYTSHTLGIRAQPRSRPVVRRSIGGTERP